MINKEQIVDLLIDAEFDYWSYDIDPPSKINLKYVSNSRYNAVAEKLLTFINQETDKAWQQGYDSAYVTWNKNSAEFYK